MPIFERGDLVAKIATIEARDATLLGQVEAGVCRQVMARIAARLGGSD